MRPIDRVLERLEGIKTHNGYYMALCPAHDDGEPSLSVSEGEDARVLLKCFAGCPFGAVVEALGLDERDLFTDGKGGCLSLENQCNGATSPRKTV